MPKPKPTREHSVNTETTCFIRRPGNSSEPTFRIHIRTTAERSQRTKTAPPVTVTHRALRAQNYFCADLVGLSYLNTRNRRNRNVSYLLVPRCRVRIRASLLLTHHIFTVTPLLPHPPPQTTPPLARAPPRRRTESRSQRVTSSPPARPSLMSTSISYTPFYSYASYSLYF